MSVLEAIERIENAIVEQDVTLQKRLDNMFLGPPGIEEQLQMVHEKSRFCLWALGRICAALKEERQQLGKKGNAP